MCQACHPDIGEVDRETLLSYESIGRAAGIALDAADHVNVTIRG